jgi:hypothetical protein
MFFRKRIETDLSTCGSDHGYSVLKKMPPINEIYGLQLVRDGMHGNECVV